MLMMAGVGGAFLTGDVFNLYVWFEVFVISSFGLLVVGTDERRIDGAVKYAILNLVATTLFLIATGYLYGVFGTLNMADLHRKVAVAGADAPLMTLAALYLVAFGMKAAAFPVNFWLPASYHTPKIVTSALFGGLLTKVGIYGLLRVLVMIMPAERAVLAGLIGWIAIATMIVGVVSALAQTDIRRMLGFALISGIGVMLAGLALGDAAGLTGHVRCGSGDLSKRRRLEAAAFPVVFRHVVPAGIGVAGLGVPCDAGVPESLVGEERFAMADAAGRSIEHLSAALLLLRKRAGVACDEAIVGRLARSDRPDVRGQRARQILGRHGPLEDCLKRRSVRLDAVDPLQRLLDGEVHLVRVGNGQQHLGFQGRGAAIPELHAPECAIDQSGGVPLADSTVHPDGQRAGVRKRTLRIVTGRARNGSVGRQALLRKQLSTEGRLRVSDRIVRWHRHRHVRQPGCGTPVSHDANDSGRRWRLDDGSGSPRLWHLDHDA